MNPIAPPVSWQRRAVMYLELIRFSHTIFALPFAVLAAVLALCLPLPSGEAIHLRVRDMAGLLLCMVFARSAAMAFNRLVDRRYDATNPRTLDRHLPAGKLGVQEVWWFIIGCCSAFVTTTALFLPNWLPLAASIPVLCWLLGYSFAKRFTASAHLWLGVALALAPLCTWVALRGIVVVDCPSDLMSPLLLSISVAWWVTGFDIIYACQDFEFDRQSGLNSIPAKFGLVIALRIAAALHAGMVLALMCLPLVDSQLGLGTIYYVTLLAVAGLLAYQHYLVRPNDLRRVGLAFFQINAVISLVLMSSAAFDAWLG